MESGNRHSLPSETDGLCSVQDLHGRRDDPASTSFPLTLASTSWLLGAPPLHTNQNRSINSINVKMQKIGCISFTCVGICELYSRLYVDTTAKRGNATIQKKVPPLRKRFFIPFHLSDWWPKIMFTVCHHRALKESMVLGCFSWELNIERAFRSTGYSPSLMTLSD